jgi:hypothetical protein
MMFSKGLDSIDDAITRWFNNLPKSWGLGMCGHTFIDNRERFYIIDRANGETYSYDQYICTKCGVEERRNSTQHTVEARRLFTKCDGTGGWKLPECLQF